MTSLFDGDPLPLDFSWFRKRKPTVADYVTWAVMLDPSVVSNKDGAFMCVVRFRGLDIDAVTGAELMGIRAAANNALKRLGSSWCLHIESRRQEVREYAESVFPEAVSEAFDAERRASFEQHDTHYESVQHITFTYLPPSEKATSARALLIEGAEPSKGADYGNELTQFRRTVESTCDLLAQSMISLELLEGDDLVTYLHGTVNDRRVQVAMPEVPMHLDFLLCSTRLVGGLAPRLGKKHLATIGVRSWPNSTTPAMLDQLNNLGIPYRWVVRWMPYSREDGLKKLARTRQLWYGKRKSMKTLLGEALSKKESPVTDQNAVEQHADCDTAYGNLQQDVYSFGHFTLTVTTEADNADQLASRARLVQQVLDGLGMVSILESVNAVEAWLGSLPGQAYADSRRPILQSLNLCDLFPLSTVWSGEAGCEHLGGPPLLTAAARGSTPFRLSLWDGDVGHTMILGPTGAGKSTLLGTLAAQFRRYPGAQVYFFDVGRSSRALTMGVGGEFHDLGGRTELNFQPLRNVDDPAERIWARDWVIELLNLAGLSPDTGQVNAISEALERLADQDERESRTLSVFRGLIQDRDLDEALAMYTAAGPFGTLLDAAQDSLRYADWQAFEMEELLQSKQMLAPTLLYIFHVLERRFATEEVAGAPTLLILDEAWSFLDNSLFAAKIRNWLKTLRKRNVAVVFASQSLADVASSSIATALIESCPTSIFLPNPRALDPSTADIYRAWGLSDAELKVISEARPKQEYYFRSRRGTRLFNLELGPFQLGLVGASGKSEQAWMDEAERRGLSGPAIRGLVPQKTEGRRGEHPCGERSPAGRGGPGGRGPAFPDHRSHLPGAEP